MEYVNGPATRYSAKVLIISDEPVAAKIWGYAVNQLGMEAIVIGATNPVIETWSKEIPDLIIIEDSNDRTEEIPILKQLRELTVAPILYLTSKTSEVFQMRLYQEGVDECIPFPITPRLFQAKVRAWIRRVGSIPLTALDEVSAGGFVLNASQRRLGLPSKEEIHLSTLESRAMFLFLGHPGRSFSSDEIIEKVWGFHNSGETNLLKHLIFRLRRKIELDPNHPRHLLYERSTGYRFVLSDNKSATV